MHNILRLVGNLRVAAKVGGGFAVVLILTAIVGAAGVFAIRGLSQQIETSQQATTVIARLQEVSAAREHFLETREPEQAQATTRTIDGLIADLDTLRARVAHQPEADARVAEALKAVRALEEEFAKVADAVTTQTEQVAALANAVVSLEALTTAIDSQVQSARRNATRDAGQAASTRDRADQLGRTIATIQERTLTIELLFMRSASTSATEALEEASALAATLPELVQSMAKRTVAGVDKAAIEALKTKAGELDGILTQLPKAEDFADLFALRNRAKDTLAAMSQTAGEILEDAYAAIDSAQAKASEAEAVLTVVNAISASAARLNRQTLHVKAASMEYFSGSDQGLESNVLGGLSVLEDNARVLLADSAQYSQIKASVEAITEEIAAYRTAFEKLVASTNTVEEARELLSTLSADVRDQIGAMAGDQASAAKAAGDAALWTIATTVLIVITAGALVAVLLTAAISRPTRRLTAVMARLAEGDTDVTLTDGDRRDEIGDMSRTVQVFRDNAVARARLEAEQTKEREAQAARQQHVETLIAEFRATVQALISSVGDTAAGLESTAQALTSIAGETTVRAEDTATASTAASRNVESVAAAAEELSASIGEISRQVGQTTAIVGKAASGTEETNRKISGLAEAASRIGDVVKLISDIAEQTNLLALNATIEAARAGDAGRGFAVVAAEVKELANQTSKATEEIGAQIGAIQGSTREAVEAIAAIAATMQEVDSYTSAIAAAVEQQGAATSEITGNVQRAADGTGAVSANMTALAEAVERTSRSADDVLSASGDVGQKTATLRQEIDRFLQAVAAA